MKTFVAMLFVVAGFLPSMHAQCDSVLQAASSDSGYSFVSAADTTNPISAEEFGPVFQFGYVADSCHVYFRFAEVLVNRHKAYLSNWCHRRLLNWDEQADTALSEWSAAEMNARSTTRIFPVLGGDTIQFYRTVSWKDRLTDAISFSRYVNPNGLSYSVELVEAGTNDRILLLDTLSISQQTGTSKPCLYSWFPVAARVRQTVPLALDSTDVFIRFNTWTSGVSPRPFYRKDRMSRMMSAYDLSHSYWINYADSVEANTCNSAPSCSLTVVGVASPSGVNISVSGSSSLDVVELRDLYGVVIWSAILPLSNSPTFVPCNPGLRIVVGRAGGQALCTRKIFVP